LATLYSRWKEVATVRQDFGSLPYQASFDDDLDGKLTTAIKNKVLDYKNNYTHFVMLIIQLIGKSSMLRGAKEVSRNHFFVLLFSFLLTTKITNYIKIKHSDLLWSNIVFSVSSSGEFKGHRTMEIVR